MDIFDAIMTTMQKRRSCRSFLPDEMDPTDQRALRVAAATAPYASGGPRREVLGPFKGMALYRACFKQESVKQCPCVWIFVGKDPGAVLRSNHAKYIFDCAAACMCMDTTAVSLGYGTCWIGHFDPAEVKKAVEAPAVDAIPTIILLTGRANGHD